jgi:hypothetical protein
VLAILFLILLTANGPSGSLVDETIPRGNTSGLSVQTTMPVYRMITSEINESVVASRASIFFESVGEVEQYDGIYLVRSGNATFEMDSRDGSMRFANYSRLWNLSLGVNVPAPENCKTVADTFLTDNGLLPEGAYFLSTGAGNVTAFSPETKEVRSKILHYQVNYGFMKDDYPVSETTASISVVVGDNGTIYSLDWLWREMEFYTESNLLSLDDIRSKYKMPANAYTIYESEIVIDGSEDACWTGPFAGPTYHITFKTLFDEGLVTTLLNVPATDLAPWVTITVPSYGAAYTPGEPVFFNCSVQSGQAPYTYLWSSNIDGDLSQQQSFSTSNLTSMYGAERDPMQFIRVDVKDANGLLATDWIWLQIAMNDNIIIGPSIFEIALFGGAIILLAIIILRRRRGGALALLLLLLFLTTFLILPQYMVSLEGDISQSQKQVPDFQIASDDDDGIKEIGIEWVGLTGWPPLTNTEFNIENFYNLMGTVGGYSREFNFGEAAAWETDFKYDALGGNDSAWVDAVDLVYYQGHGHPDGIFFSSHRDDHFLDHSEARWGDGDLEWIVLDAFSLLAWENENGENVFERWGSAFQGLHMICSFATESQNARVRGLAFAEHLTSPYYNLTIKDAWFKACAATEESSHWAAVLYATTSPDPWNPQLDDPIHDHAHGFGYVSSDPTPSTTKWFVWIASQC